VSSRRDLFANFSSERDEVDETDPWQFNNFLIRD
jgi:homospermidine synthase